MAKSKYETAVLPRLEEVRSWIRDGATDKEVCRRLGITSSTFYLYKTKYPEFSETISKTKDVIDSEVVNAGYKRATGYFVDEEEKVYDGQGNLISRKVKSKYIAPDPRMIEWWLAYRQRNTWGAMVEATDSDTGGVVMISERDVIEVPKDE